jgi:acetophenone carboxylase
VGRARGLWRICCTAKKNGDSIILDFTGTSPENNSSWNAMPWVTVCYTALYMYSHGFYDLPTCAGTLAPIDFRIPDGCVLSANWDAAISAAPPLCENIHVALTGIFARMMFSSPADRVEIAGHTAGGAGGGGGRWTGVNQWGDPFVGESTWAENASGQGAHSTGDGMDSALFASGVHSTGSDAEEVEVDRPFVHLWQKHQKDSPGNGKYRGGASGYYCSVVYGVPYLKRSSIAARGRIPGGQGIFGGYPSFAMINATISKSNVLELMVTGEGDLPTSVQDMVRKRIINGDYQVHATERAPGRRQPGRRNGLR